MLHRTPVPGDKPRMCLRCMLHMLCYLTCCDMLQPLLQVYEATREGAPWQQLLQPGQTLGVHCMHFYNNSNITNSQLVARRVRDAVCDAVRDARWVLETQAEGATLAAAAAGYGGKQPGKPSCSSNCSHSGSDTKSCRWLCRSWPCTVCELPSVTQSGQALQTQAAGQQQQQQQAMAFASQDSAPATLLLSFCHSS
jgi:hypothetical protein